MVCPFMAFIQKSLLVIETFGDFRDELEGSHDEDFKTNILFYRMQWLSKDSADWRIIK